MSSHLLDASLNHHHLEAPNFGPDRLMLRDLLASFEKNLIVTALLAAGGNQRRAAQALGVLPTTLQEKLKRLGLLEQHFGRRARRGPRAMAWNQPAAPHPEASHPPQTEEK